MLSPANLHFFLFPLSWENKKKTHYGEWIHLTTVHSLSDHCKKNFIFLKKIRSGDMTSPDLQPQWLMVVIPGSATVVSQGLTVVLAPLGAQIQKTANSEPGLCESGGLLLPCRAERARAVPGNGSCLRCPSLSSRCPRLESSRARRPWGWFRMMGCCWTRSRPAKMASLRPKWRTKVTTLRLLIPK